VKGWTRDQIIALISVFVAIVACIAAVVVVPAGFPADRHPCFCINNPTDTITDANHRPAKTYVNRVSWVDSYAHLPGS